MLWFYFLYQVQDSCELYLCRLRRTIMVKQVKAFSLFV